MMGKKVLAAKSGRAACPNAAAGGGIAAKRAKGAKSFLTGLTVFTGLREASVKPDKTKPSGVEWIGDIPEGWEVRRLRYLATSFRKGAGITRADVIETGDISCIRYGDIYSKYKNDVAVIKCLSKTNRHLISTPQRIFKGDILFSCTGELVDDIGKNITYMGDEECLAGGDIIIVSHNQNPVFLSYALNSYVQTQKSHDKAKLKVVHISTGDIKNLLIVLPPLPVQRAIAAFLDEKCRAIDAAVAEAKKGIEEYKAWKKSLIFEVVTGKRRVGFFNAESKCARDEMHLRRSRQVTRGHRPSPVGGASGCVVGLPERSEPEGLQRAARRRGAEKMKPSGIPWIGTIPEGWAMVKASKIFSVITDFVASGSFADLRENVKYLDCPDYAQLIRTADVSGKSHELKPVYISKESYDFLSGSNLYGGELLLPNIGASVGDVYIVPRLYERMSLAPNAIMVKNSSCDKFYFYFFSCDSGRLALEDIAESTAQPKFNKTDFRNLRLPAPATEEQQAIADYLNEKCAAIDAIVAEKEALIADLEAYKKSLIYETVTGKREVA